MCQSVNSVVPMSMVATNVSLFAQVSTQQSSEFSLKIMRLTLDPIRRIDFELHLLIRCLTWSETDVSDADEIARIVNWIRKSSSLELSLSQLAPFTHISNMFCVNDVFCVEIKLKSPR